MSANEKRFKVGVDIGGTFTDLVVHETESGEQRVVKEFTTRDDPSKGFVAAVDGAEIDATEVEAFLTHGSTTALNTVLTRTGANVGFIGTRGHRDILDIGRAVREEGHLYDPSWQRPHVERPIVPRYLRRTVRERILADGSVLHPLDEEELVEVLDRFKAEDVSVVAVCFLNSYANPAHEQRAREVIAEHWPEVWVELSSEIAPVPREYDRAITLALDSYISPVLRAYLGQIDTEIRRRGFDRDLYVMQSHGGLVEADILRKAPIGTLMSGPVAGVLGAKYLGEALEVPNILTFDMGGTSTDVAAITGGELSYSKRFQIEWDIYSVLPMVEINSVGQGGGSIAWIDSGGAIRVGPQSAGASPGPVCYGRGGTEPTTTDANLIRGVLQPDTFVGGTIGLDKEAARSAIERLAKRLDTDVEEAARGIGEIANANMMEAIRGVTIYKGIDPRDYALLSYGSAGGQHVSTIAGELGIGEVIVPAAPGTFSAFGLICSDLKIDRTDSVVRDLAEISEDELTSAFERLEREALEAMAAQNVDPERAIVQRFIEGHYLGQTWETPAKAPPGRIDAAKREQLAAEFHATHERLWAFRAEDLPITILNVRVAVLAATEKPKLPELERGSGVPSRDAVMFERDVQVGGAGSELAAREVPFLARERLLAGDEIAGPAAVVEKTSTTWLPPGDLCRVDRHGNLRITKEDQ